MKLRSNPLRVALTIAALSFTAGAVLAADHAEAPLVAADQASDVADLYAFVDPNNNANVVLAFDVHGFIVPGENHHFGGFDSSVLYRFKIENSGDAVADMALSVRFDEQTSRSVPQTARVTLGPVTGETTARFDAVTTVASATAAAAPASVVTTDSASGISFFAGLTEDPFFFDIPGFNRFAAAVLGGSRDESLLNRGRDTFAGYNVQMIAVSVPASMLLGNAGSVIGVSAITLRKADVHYSANNDPRVSGKFRRIDRVGVPGINTFLIPFSRKNAYNRATPTDDADGLFAADIVGTLVALGTDQAHIDILADVAVTHGDYLRLNTATANTGPQGGTNDGAGFPNGRRPADDVVDTFIFLLTNEVRTTGDHVDANDVPFRDVFPFFAASRQPLEAEILDDNTRN